MTIVLTISIVGFLFYCARMTDKATNKLGQGATRQELEKCRKRHL